MSGPSAERIARTAFAIESEAVFQASGVLRESFAGQVTSDYYRQLAVVALLAADGHVEALVEMGQTRASYQAILLG